jgi:hypothetical protein
MWVHRNCGGKVESILLYSDMEQDYYFPVCEKCQKKLEVSEMVQESAD